MNPLRLFRRRKMPAPVVPVELVRSQRGAELWRYSDGLNRCRVCPFACMAAYEPCEFAS